MWFKLKGQCIAFVFLWSRLSNKQWCYVKHVSHHEMLRRKWLRVEITSKMMIPRVVLVSLSSVQKACSWKTLLLLLASLWTVEWVANLNRWLANVVTLFESNANGSCICCRCFTLMKLILPVQGHPHGIMMCYFVVSEIRHMIFYGHKNHMNHNKLIF